jgi:peroxiredoxin
MMKRISMLIVAVLAVSALTVFAQGDAASDYQTLSRDLEALNQRAMRESTMQGRLDILAEIKDKLTAFREKHPDTPEAADAGFQLGMVAHSVAMLKQDPSLYSEAVQYLSRYALSQDNPREKVAYAHYYLAEAYKGMSKFDDAQAEYQQVLNEFNDVNPKLTQFARMNLADLETQRKLSVGSEPIDFEVKSISGQTLSPDQYKGKVLLLDFWATWCAPCKAEMPNVKKVYQKYNPKGFEIVGISLDRSRQALDNYISQNNIEWPQYFDGKYWNNDIAQQYGVRSIPATYLIDKKGKIRYKSLRGRQLEKAVERLLDEEG